MPEEALSDRSSQFFVPGLTGHRPFATTKVGQLTSRSYCSQPGTLIIVLAGELDLAAAPALEELFNMIECDGWPTVVVDLSRLSFVDCAGVRVLLKADQRIGRLGGRMVVRDASRAVRRVLAVIGADRVLDLVSSAEIGTRVELRRRLYAGLDGL